MFPLHGLGGLERSVHDLVNYLEGAGLLVTVITRPPLPARPATIHPATPGREQSAGRPPVTYQYVPYRTFPFAGRRGTTVIDRSTAYPLFGLRAGASGFSCYRAASSGEA